MAQKNFLSRVTSATGSRRRRPQRIAGLAIAAMLATTGLAYAQTDVVDPVSGADITALNATDGCTSANTLFVSPSGFDGYNAVTNTLNDGRITAPVLTINFATALLHIGFLPVTGSVGAEDVPGCIYAEPGTYQEQVFAGGVSASVVAANAALSDDSVPAYVVYRSLVPHQAILTAPDNNNGATLFNGSGPYLKIVDFAADGRVGQTTSTDGIVSTEDCFAFGTSNNTPTIADGAAINNNNHHIIVQDSVAHDCGGSGISVVFGDLITISGNSTYNNATTSQFQKSGISIFGPAAAADSVMSVIDQSQPRITVFGNSSFNNIIGPTVTANHTDGNGIIFDTFAQNAYFHPSYLFNNVVYGNGGGGIQVDTSSYVTASGNGSFGNRRDQLSSDTVRGEINFASICPSSVISDSSLPTTAIYGDQVLGNNAIAVAGPGVLSNNIPYVYENFCSGQGTADTGFGFTDNKAINPTVGGASFSPGLLSAVGGVPDSSNIAVDPLPAGGSGTTGGDARHAVLAARRDRPSGVVHCASSSPKRGAALSCASIH